MDISVANRWLGDQRQQGVENKHGGITEKEVNQRQRDPG